MTAQILKNVQLFAGGVNLTSFNNKLELAAEVEEKECTTFGSYDSGTDTVWREYIGGLAKAKLSASGPNAYADDSVDETTFAALGGFGAISACPSGTTVGNIAWLTYALQGNYKSLGQVGDIAPWEANWSSSAPLVRGVSLHPATTARTSSGSGTGVQIGAVSSSQKMWAALHVLSVAGTSSPTITVKLQSDDNGSFTSATDRITFSAATAVGGQWSSVAGAITDDYWRIVWTISGTDPSFLLLASAGIY